MALIASNIIAVSKHLMPWRNAAVVRDVFEAAAADDWHVTSCGTVRIINPPDNVRGAYVLRNGAAEALARDVGLSFHVGDATPDCTFYWNAVTHSFDQK
jgi:hypothetical protein